MNRCTTTIVLATALLSCAALGVACGGDDSKNNDIHEGGAVTGPDNPERDRPAKGPPAGDAGNAFDDVSAADVDQGQNGGQAETDAGEGANCCSVEFALADPHPGVDANWARLFGTISPLDAPDGVDMTLQSGVWSATACVPPESIGTYHFEFAYPSDDGGEDYVESAVSPFVPTANGPDGVANQWTPVQDCESLDASIYAQTEE
jgi:hypothetical protein